MNKSSYFSLPELCQSYKADLYGINNVPTDEEVKLNLQALIDNVLDPLRTKYGHPIIVNSGFRCQELNSIVGGASTSQHLKGQAADITGGSIDQNKILLNILRNMLPYDQVILEKGGVWLHVSYKRFGFNRHSILKLN